MIISLFRRLLSKTGYIPILAMAFLSLMSVSAADAADYEGLREQLLQTYAAETKSADPAFATFSAERGGILFSTKHGTGKPETPACTACHSVNPRGTGQTRAGKPIDPIAVSGTADRFTDPEKVEKWFIRNCDSVLGRPCTALEKGDFITFMKTQ